MTLASMTGFARVEGAHDGRRWAWELRSVNGRGLEARFRLPPGFDFVEPDLRKAVTDAFSRGSVSISLVLEKVETAGALRVNERALEDVLRLIEAVSLRIDCAKPRPEGVLSVRGVLETDDAEPDEDARVALGKALTANFRDAVQALAAARRAEGEKLASLLSAQVGDVERLTSLARGHAESAPEAIRARIEQQLKELLGGAIPEDRLAQEAAMLAMRADVREELDRLAAHVEQARTLIADTAPSGRRLDFLTQEFNREANTLCSKAQDMGLKRLGLDLKTVIDQMREQVQNVE